MPASKVRIAAALVIGSSWVLVPIIVLLALLAPLGNRSPGTDWFLIIAMVATSLLALNVAVRSSGRQQRDIAIALVVALSAGIYQGFVLRLASVFASYEPPIKTSPSEAIYTIQNCLTRYKDVHGGYPKTSKRS